MQFSLRTLIIAAMFLGPLSGWYGPWLVAQLQDLMANDPPPQPIVQYQLRSPPQQLQMRPRSDQLGSEGIERGMQVDMLERVQKQGL
jgi:hypothetical protein